MYSESFFLRFRITSPYLAYKIQIEVIQNKKKS